MLHVRTKQCATCIYFPQSHFNVVKLEHDIADERAKGHFKGYRVCHDTPGFPQTGPKSVCCRGFWDRHKDKFDMGQLAQRLGWVRFVIKRQR